MKHNPNGSIQPKLADIGATNTAKIWKEVLHSMMAVLTARLNYTGTAYVKARMWGAQDGNSGCKPRTKVVKAAIISSNKNNFSDYLLGGSGGVHKQVNTGDRYGYHMLL